jgi:hypothetical protein
VAKVFEKQYSSLLGHSYEEEKNAVAISQNAVAISQNIFIVTAMCRESSFIRLF